MVFLTQETRDKLDFLSHIDGKSEEVATILCSDTGRCCAGYENAVRMSAPRAARKRTEAAKKRCVAPAYQTPLTYALVLVIDIAETVRRFIGMSLDGACIGPRQA